MKKSLKLLLLVDVIIRFIGLAGFTIFIGAVYENTGRALSVGLVGLATALPSLLALAYANHITLHFSALRLLQGVTAFRLLTLLSLTALPHSPLMIMIAAGLQSLSHQVSISTKMTLDAEFLDETIRRKYLARKAMLSNIAVVCAPAAGGLIVGLFGYSAALFALSIPCAGLLLLLMVAPKPERLSDSVAIGATGLRIAFRRLFAMRHVFAVVGLFCIVAVILEIQAPLIFPFVHDVYSADSRLGGMLLGLCGFGGLAGAYAAERWPGFFLTSSIPLLVCIDGLLFLCFTQLTNLFFASVLFTMLGAMGAITLILVESVVQTDVDTANRPFVFSLMQFAGGAGGATLAVLAAFLADELTTKLVLSGAAVVEVAIGICCLVAFRNVWKKPVLPSEKVD